MASALMDHLSCTGFPLFTCSLVPLNQPQKVNYHSSVVFKYIYIGIVKMCQGHTFDLIFSTQPLREDVALRLEIQPVLRTDHYLLKARVNAASMLHISSRGLEQYWWENWAESNRVCYRINWKTREAVVIAAKKHYSLSSLHQIVCNHISCLK